jgi:hypothetical protein
VVGHEKFSPFVDRPLLWQQAVRRSKRTFANWHQCYAVPKKVLSPSFFVFPNFKIRFPGDYFDKPNFGVSQGILVEH